LIVFTFYTQRLSDAYRLHLLRKKKKQNKTKKCPTKVIDSKKIFYLNTVGKHRVSLFHIWIINIVDFNSCFFFFVIFAIGRPKREIDMTSLYCLLLYNTHRDTANCQQCFNSIFNGYIIKKIKTQARFFAVWNDIKWATMVLNRKIRYLMWRLRKQETTIRDR